MSQSRLRIIGIHVLHNKCISFSLPDIYCWNIIRRHFPAEGQQGVLLGDQQSTAAKDLENSTTIRTKTRPQPDLSIPIHRDSHIRSTYMIYLCEKLQNTHTLCQKFVFLVIAELMIIPGKNQHPSFWRSLRLWSAKRMKLSSYSVAVKVRIYFQCITGSVFHFRRSHRSSLHQAYRQVTGYRYMIVSSFKKSASL